MRTFRAELGFRSGIIHTAAFFLVTFKEITVSGAKRSHKNTKCWVPLLHVSYCKFIMGKVTKFTCIKCRDRNQQMKMGVWQSTRNGNVVKSWCGGTGEGRGKGINNNHSSLNSDRCFLNNDHSPLLCVCTRALGERRCTSGVVPWRSRFLQTSYFLYLHDCLSLLGQTVTVLVLCK